MRQAMVAGDALALGASLAADFTLTHMTGYVQSKEEWLADVRSGAMSYHSIDDVDLSFMEDDELPVLTAQTRTAATIWGSTGIWPLQLEVYFADQDGSWAVADVVASTW